MINIAFMLASIAQGSDYRVLDCQAKRLQRVNDVRVAWDKSVLAPSIKQIQLELSRVQ
ncbi:hypothetical protein OU997_18180 [Pseudomonas sp. SL4(2022)]|uniref:hypothetical protein n=1 Tax=Pseudomonas sp. SL4(2022) TaxID=2994661 RepID=UPI001304D8F3|nr:hypothetical protein [Pseudomonas sp. SL4(2022)]WAC44145.1 hypothetical protein OU997_18180 [Pseudomonas sp. SL4(2022)]